MWAGEVFDGVAGDAEEPWGGAALAHHGGDAVGVGVVDVAGRERIAGGRDLVAGGKDGHDRAPVDRHRIQTDAGEHADLRRADDTAGGDDGLAVGNVLGAVAEVRAGRGCLEHLDDG